MNPVKAVIKSCRNRITFRFQTQLYWNVCQSVCGIWLLEKTRLCTNTTWGLHTVWNLRFVFDRKLWLLTRLPDIWSIYPFNGWACQKCTTEYPNWLYAPQCRSLFKQSREILPPLKNLNSLVGKHRERDFTVVIPMIMKLMPPEFSAHHSALIVVIMALAWILISLFVAVNAFDLSGYECLICSPPLGLGWGKGTKFRNRNGRKKGFVGWF